MKQFFTVMICLMATIVGTQAATVETTLWEDTYTDGVELNSATVATFAEGDVLRVYVTVPAGGANFKICYKGESNDWAETTIPSIDNQWPWVNGGNTYADFTLTAADITALAGNNIYIYKGDNSTIDKVTLITTVADEEPTGTSTVWSGSNALGNWANFEVLRYDGKGDLANVKVGDVIRVTFTDASDGWQIYVCDAATYSNFTGGYFDGAAQDGEQSVSFKVADAEVLESIALKGIVVKGKLATLTKVELLTYASSYDAAAVTIGEEGMATWSSSKKLSFEGTGIKVYYASAVATGTVTLTSTTTAWYYQGYVLVGDKGTYTVPVTTEAEYPSTNYLKATSDYAADLSASTTTEFRYIFAKSGSDLGFYYLGSDYTLAAHRAYLQTDTDIRTTGESNARIAMIFSDDTTTGIHMTAIPSANNDVLYNLSGQQVAQPTKGLYIRNGKKIIIK